MSDRTMSVVAAEAGAGEWRAAVVALRKGPVDHSDFYAIAGDLVATVGALQEAAEVLAERVATYGASRILRDDEGAVPADRLADAVAELRELRAHLGAAEAAANAFWSTIGHVGVEVDGTYS